MTVLDGSRVEIYSVENPQDEEERSETLIGATTESIEIDNDPNTADWPEHMVSQIQRRELQGEAEASLVFLLTSTLDNLLAAQVYTENEEYEIYEPSKNYRHDAIEFHIFDPFEDVVQQVYRAYEAQPVVENNDLDIEGPVQIESAIWFQGPHGFVSDGATTDATEE